MDDVHSQLTITDITMARTEPVDEYDTIITVCQDDIADHVPDGTTYHFFSMADGPHCGYGGDSSYELFEMAAETLLWALEDGDRVLIHCHMGQSRSVAVAIAALAVHEDVDYRAARNTVVDRRPQARPDQLLEEHAQQFVSERRE